MGALEEIAAELKARGVSGLVRVRQGVVSSGPAAGVYTVTVGDTAVAGVPYLSSTKGGPGPRAGETVWMIQSGTDLMIVGVLGDQADGNQRWELYGATPFIDFHFNNTASDFDVRLINDAAGRLTTVGQHRATTDVVADGNLRGTKLLLNGITSFAGGESIETGGGQGGISVRQRSRGATDTTARIVYYANSDAGYIWQGRDLIVFKDVAGALDVRFNGVPALAGNTAIINTGSWQMGYLASTREFKENIQGLGALGLANPIFDLEPRLWDYRSDVRARSDVKAQKLHSVGFVAEEVEQVIPEATWGDLNKPTGLNTEALLAFAVGALKTLKAEYEQLRRDHEELKARAVLRGSPIDPTVLV